ncbi:hypothetical protein C450_19636 [Halococcus salifodinae DSM 8989]|uniref:Uncharacterized protein n=1 Tax=Halococcus salifodinae DSM 8989 TaxID=1227456 RepID=M0MT73_9EURY|nr:hypothetical protein C450_19636 [Halococcus salifodinae DSM 8989]
MVVLLENFVDAVIGKRETVSDTEDVRDDDRASASALAEVKHSIFEVVGMVRVGFAAGYLQLWNLSALAVGFGELLDPPPTNLELLGDQPRVHVVFDNSLTYPGDIILIKFHLT